MTYELLFAESALREWQKLDATIRTQFKKKLKERLENPRIASSALHGMPDAYKIKLKQLGYRLVYTVQDQTVTVTVIAVGKRERSAVYEAAAKRLRQH